MTGMGVCATALRVLATLAPLSFAFASHAGELAAGGSDVLTQIDTSPTREELAFAFDPDPLQHLAAIAIDPTVDFGMRLRAIRALPLFCPTTGCVGSEAHLAIQSVLDSGEDDTAGRKILLMRAAIEALGVAKTGDDADVARLVPFLSNDSRDLRAASARALAVGCNPLAADPLRARIVIEQVAQVRTAITAALADLVQCP